MDLILWRHAQAEDLSKTVTLDSERQLTAKGQQQAVKMALWLNKVLPTDCQILVSPSQRTLQTAQALGRQFKIENRVGTGSSAKQILAACGWPTNRSSVLVVSHQPLLGQVVSQLIPEIHYAAIQKANVWWISQKQSGEIFLKAVISPELVSAFVTHP